MDKFHCFCRLLLQNFSGIANTFGMILLTGNKVKTMNGETFPPQTACLINIAMLLRFYMTLKCSQPTPLIGSANPKIDFDEIFPRLLQGVGGVYS